MKLLSRPFLGSECYQNVPESASRFHCGELSLTSAEGSPFLLEVIQPQQAQLPQPQFWAAPLYLFSLPGDASFMVFSFMGTLEDSQIY